MGSFSWNKADKLTAMNIEEIKSLLNVDNYGR